MKQNLNTHDKRGLSADGKCSLLPSALRPRLSRARIESKKIAIFSMIALLSVVAFSVLLSSSHVSAASLTLTVPAGGLRLDVNPTPEGTYLKSDVGKIAVKTDAFAGYTLDIKAKSSSDLINGENKISSISEETTEEEYQSSGNKNTWTWQPSKFKSSDNTKFLPAPTLEPAVIEKTDSKNDVENNCDIYIATKIDNTLPTGEYKNDFVLTASANSVPYSIKYEIGEEATGAPEPNPDTGSSTEQTIKLSKTEPTREDYEFLGWCSEPTSDENCNGETKQPGDDITLTNSDNQFTFYAIWKPIILYMQTWDGCDELGMEETITLRDIRDNNDYTIAKLKDNKCWMTQNLRLGDNKSITLTPVDTDTSKTFILPAYTIDAHKSTTSEAEVYRDSNYWQSRQYGYYYNFYASTLGTGIGIRNGSQATDSICPRDWKLPSIGDFNNIILYYNNNALSQPLNFVLAGLAHGNTTIRQEYCGEYISNTRGDQPTNDMMWVYNNGSMVVGSDCNEGCGFSVRCVFASK